MGDLGSIHLFRRHRPELRDISAAVLLSAAPGGPQDLDDGVAAAPDAADDVCDRHPAGITSIRARIVAE